MRYSWMMPLLLAPFALSAMAATPWTPPAQQADPVTNGSEIRATAADPTGDNFNPGPDLTSISASTDGTNLTVVLTFAGAIQPPPGMGNEVIGFIDIDTDQNAATGAPGGNVGIFCPSPPAAFGSDFFIDLGSFDAMANTFDVFDSTATFVGTAQATYGATSVTAVVANATLGDDGIADLNTVIGNQPAPTDCAPDGAVLTSDVAGTPPPAVAVPALSAVGLLLLAALLAALTGFTVYRRRSA